MIFERSLILQQGVLLEDYSGDLSFNISLMNANYPRKRAEDGSVDE